MRSRFLSLSLYVLSTFADIERFSIECRKTKTKTKLLRPITKNENNTKDQSEFEANSCNRCQARENTCERGTIGFTFASHWLTKWREFVNQSQSAIKQKQSNYQMTFDTQLKTTLFNNYMNL